MIEENRHIRWRWRQFLLMHTDPLLMSKFPVSLYIINKYPANRNPGKIIFPYHWNILVLLLKSWCLCLFIRFFYAPRYVLRWNFLHPFSSFLWSPSQAQKYISSSPFIMALLLQRVTLRLPPRAATESISIDPCLLGRQLPPWSHTAKCPLDFPGDR